MLKVTSTVILQKQAFWGLNESGDLGGDSKKPQWLASIQTCQIRELPQESKVISSICHHLHM